MGGLRSCLAWLLSHPAWRPFTFSMFTGKPVLCYYKQQLFQQPPPPSSHIHLHPSTEHFLERAIYTAPSISSLSSILSITEAPPPAKLLIHCRPNGILQVHRQASSKLWFPSLTPRDTDSIDWGWGLGISQYHSPSVIQVMLKMPRAISLIHSAGRWCW